MALLCKMFAPEEALDNVGAEFRWQCQACVCEVNTTSSL
jgi:hypothetical protein